MGILDYLQTPGARRGLMAIGTAMATPRGQSAIPGMIGGVSQLNQIMAQNQALQAQKEQEEREAQQRSALDQLSFMNTPGARLPMSRFAGMSPEEMQAERMSLMTQADPAFGLKMMQQQMLPQAPKPTSLMQNIQAMGLQPGTPEYEQAVREAVMKPESVINIGQGKPLGKDAAGWIDTEGNSPPPTMDVYEADAAGFKPISTDKRKAIESAQQAAPLLGEMVHLGFGDKDSIFPEADEGFLPRMWGGAVAFGEAVAETDERLTLYRRSKKSILSGLARLSGQVGTLTEQDVSNVEGLFPTPGFTPKPIAKEQFKFIAKMLRSKGVPVSMLEGIGFPAWALDGEEKKPIDSFM